MKKFKRVSFDTNYDKIEYSVTCLYKIENRLSNKVKFCNASCLFNYCNEHLLVMSRKIF